MAHPAFSTPRPGLRAALAAVFVAGLVACGTARPSLAAEATVQTSAGALQVERILDGLNEPWAVGFLPGGGFLVTERAGRLIHVDPAGAVIRVAGLPEVYAQGQGGLLDLLVPRDFAQRREILFTFSEAQGRGAGTAVATARLSEDGARLNDMRVLFRSASGWSGGRHFGSRLAEGPDGHIFFSVGDRGDDTSAQDRSNHNGAILRINRDGSVPADNPFSGQAGMQPEIWTWGNRNPQGLAFDAAGRLWSTEHGPRGGDELNLIEAGRNYGWPVIGEGVHYSGRPMPRGRETEGMVRPVAHWSPALAPSGLAAYSGRMWPEWAGSLLIGSLQQDRIVRVDPAANFVEESLEAPLMARIRDVREAPDGSIWFLSVGEGALFRMVPGG